MSETSSQVVGYIAGSLTTACVIPQIVHVIRCGSSTDLSYAFVCMLIVGLTLWLTYGFLISEIPVIVPNAISLILNLFLLGIKLRHDFRSRYAPAADDTRNKSIANENVV